MSEFNYSGEHLDRLREKAKTTIVLDKKLLDKFDGWHGKRAHIDNERRGLKEGDIVRFTDVFEYGEVEVFREVEWWKRIQWHEVLFVDLKLAGIEDLKRFEDYADEFVYVFQLNPTHQGWMRP